jgi:nicotinamide-nucleotide amidase
LAFLFIKHFNEIPEWIMNKHKINSLVKGLKEKKLTLVLAESITCGLAAHKLSSCKGIAEVLKASLVCYTPEAKNTLLNIPKNKMDKFTCESMIITKLLAQSLSKLIEADIYCAITGLASKGGSETKNKPVGTVFFCIIYKNKMYTDRKLFKGSPLEIKEKACYGLYDLINKKIIK